MLSLDRLRQPGDIDVYRWNCDMYPGAGTYDKMLHCSSDFHAWSSNREAIRHEDALHQLAISEYLLGAL